MFHHSKSKHINFVKARQAIDKLASLAPQIEKRRRLRKIYRIMKYLIGIFAALFLAVLVLSSGKISSLIEIYNQAILGKTNLEQAIALAQNNYFDQAGDQAKAAVDNFNKSIFYLSQARNSRLLNHSPYIISQLNDIESLMISAQFLSKTVLAGVNFGKSLESILSGNKKLNFSKLSSDEKHRILGKIFESAPELNGIKANLNLAYFNLERINYNGLLSPFKERIDEIKIQIKEASRIMDQAVPLSQLLPALAGYPGPATYLILLENSDELRPTGGFLGTYGILKIQDGEILDFATHDIYHLDMPVKDKINITPPAPLKKYLVPKWYLRDANWSPDWPTAAEKINWFYQAESRLNPAAEKISEIDGVIALTPALIIDLLKITGPVAIEGQNYNQGNFMDLLEYRVEKGYVELGISSWQRKEVIGEISKKIKEKIFDLAPADWSRVFNIATDNLVEKNLLVYLNDDQLENIIIDNGWGGEIKDFAGDYLMVVDANLGALKTDGVMNRSLEYKIREGANGVFSELTIGYSHQGKPSWKISAYKSYTRIYVPYGSQLIKVSDYDLNQIDIGNEFGKTYFGFYLKVEPEKIKTITVEYKLPGKISSKKTYGLYVQKQPGKEIDEAIIDLSFNNDIESYQPSSLSAKKVSPTRLRWQGDLNIDRSFEINF